MGVSVEMVRYQYGRITGRDVGYYEAQRKRLSRYGNEKRARVVIDSSK